MTELPQEGQEAERVMENMAHISQSGLGKKYTPEGERGSVKI
jgi:hypothetical protein